MFSSSSSIPPLAPYQVSDVDPSAPFLRFKASNVALNPAGKGFPLNEGTKTFAYLAGQNNIPKIQQVLASSLDGSTVPVFSAKQYNSFFSTLLSAYNGHYRLSLRPDDVWLAIMLQFCCYVQANAEALRDKFVAHEGKVKLIVALETCMKDGGMEIDFPKVCGSIVEQVMPAFLNDKGLIEWFLPGFTTTTPHDRAVAAMATMSTLRSYFTYSCGFQCGIPEVEMCGTLDDWKALRQRVDGLLKFEVAEDSKKKKHPKDPNTIVLWHELLSGVLDEFIRSRSGNIHPGFWNTCVKQESHGSGGDTVSGWATAFLMFTKEGYPLDRHGTVRHLLWDTCTNQKYGYAIVDMDEVPSAAVGCELEIMGRKGTVMAGQVFVELRGVEGEGGVAPRSDWMIGWVEAKKGGCECGDKKTGEGNKEE